ncbi:MAG: transcriptional regulator with XRE-family HTH domain [Janthinobacterium sp.]|jgi:transcriptional regulator with XRE-family HTH domain
MFTQSELMAKKTPTLAAVPTLVAERLASSDMCIRKQRIDQRIRARDLCERLGISHPTLQRMERGESTVSAGGYLAALHVLGVLEHAAPGLRTDLWHMDTPAGRARPENEHDDDYF